MRVEASTRLASDALAMSIDEVARMVQDIELRYQKWVAAIGIVVEAHLVCFVHTFHSYFHAARSTA